MAKLPADLQGKVDRGETLDAIDKARVAAYTLGQGEALDRIIAARKREVITRWVLLGGLVLLAWSSRRR